MSFDLRKYLAEGGIEARLNEDHSGNPNDKYVVKKCTKKEGEPWAVWEGKTRVKGFASKAEAEKYAKKQNKKQNLKEGEETQGMSDNDFIMALNKAFAAADDIMEEGVEEGIDPDEDDDNITPPGIEDMSPDPMFGPNPSFVEEDIDEGKGRPSGSGRERAVNFKIFTGDKSEENILRLLKKFNKLYVSPKNPTLDPRAKKPRKPFSDEELQNLATLFASGEPITSKKIMAAIPRYKSTAPANTFLRVMDEMGRSGITSVDKKVQDIEAKQKRDSGETPETRGRRKKTADDDFGGGSIEGPSDDELADIEKELGLEENTKFLNRILKSPLVNEMKEVHKNDKMRRLIKENMLDNKSILRMQKLAGLITESDIKKTSNLNENFNPEPASQGDWDDANPPEAFGFVVEIYPKDSDDNDGAFNFSAPEVEVFFDTINDFDSNEEAKAHFNKLFDPSQEDMWYEFIEREAAEIGVRDFEYESFQPMIIR